MAGPVPDPCLHYTTQRQRNPELQEQQQQQQQRQGGDSSGRRSPLHRPPNLLPLLDNTQENYDNLDDVRAMERFLFPFEVTFTPLILSCKKAAFAGDTMTNLFVDVQHVYFACVCFEQICRPFVRPTGRTVVRGRNTPRSLPAGCFFTMYFQCDSDLKGPWNCSLSVAL